jgi:D-ribose pyranose/furanose isomerase RbsD
MIRYIKITTLILLVIILNLQACSENEKKPLSRAVWKQQLEAQLSLLGHRNWILIVDKAFPLQTTDGVSMVYAEEDLLDVLEYTLSLIEENNHIKPIIYKDKELGFINQDLVPGIDGYKSSLEKIIGESSLQVLLHDSVFVKIDEASKLFKTLVIKTNQVIPYSSVFIELDCDYWSTEKEVQLRKLIQNPDMKIVP